MSAAAKKVVVRLDLHDDKDKKKAMENVSSLLGIDSLTMDMKEKKLTVVGAVDPVDVVKKLRKCWYPEILTVGPAKEEKKKEEPKESSKADGGNKDKQISELLKAVEDYNRRAGHAGVYYVVQSAVENPNGCPMC